MGVQQWLVIASVVALTAASAFQARGIFNKTKSAVLVTWLIWSVVNAVSFAAQYYAGSTQWELFVPLSQLASTLVLLLVSAFVIMRRRIWHEEPIDWGDGLALLCCVAGVGAGVLFDDPFIALWGNVAANIAGLVPMVIRGRKHPASVTRSYWMFRGLATLLATTVFLANGINAAGLIPQVTGLFIAGTMLWVSSSRRPTRRPLLNTVELDPHPMLSIGSLR